MRSFADLAAADIEHFARIGHFAFWFSAVELAITNILIRCLGYDELGEKSFERADILINRMDARAKCERLIQASKIGMPIGPHLLKRVGHFQSAVIPLRNKFAHRVPQPKRSKIIFSQSIDLKPGLAKATEIHIDDLFQTGEWLNWLADDLARALNHSKLTGTLEISRPRSTEHINLRSKLHKGRDANSPKQPKKPSISGPFGGG